MKRVVIIGAGATGLVAALLLRDAGLEVTLVEASPRAGGLLATFEAAPGVHLEHFYHHVFTHDAEVRWLLGRVGLAEALTFAPSTMGLYREGQLYPFDGPLDLLRFDALSLVDRVRFLVSSALLVAVPGYARAEQTPALAWLRRTAGRAATDAIWRPLMVSKFGDVAEQVPLAWMAGRLRQRARSREATGERLGYLQGSLQCLVDALVDHLQAAGVTLHLGTPVTQLRTAEGRVQGIETATGAIHADAVLATLPTPLLADLVAPEAPAYADALRQVDYLGALCTVLALDAPLSPVYWLNVADPGYSFGGVIEQTHLVPASHYGGRHLVYLSRYLPVTHPLWTLADDALLDQQQQELARLFGRPVRPQQRWVFRGRYAAPAPTIGFPRHIPAFRSPVRGLFVAAMPHVYPDERSVNNSVRVAAEAVSAMGVDTAQVPQGASLAGRYGR